MASAEHRIAGPKSAVLEATHGFAVGPGANHCTYRGHADSVAADKAEALAILHQNMAKEVEPANE